MGAAKEVRVALKNECKQSERRKKKVLTWLGCGQRGQMQTMQGQHSTRVPGKNVSKEKKTKKRKEKLTGIDTGGGREQDADAEGRQ